MDNIQNPNLESASGGPLCLAGGWQFGDGARRRAAPQNGFPL